MKITIRTKLIASFVLFVVLIVAVAIYSVVTSEESLKESIGTSSMFLAEEMLRRIDEGVYLKLEGFQRYLIHPFLNAALVESNREFEKLPDVEGFIEEKDREWISAPRETITPFMKDLLDNELSKDLRREFVEFYKRKYGYDVFSEVFLTNKYGATIALTGKTSDYLQSDEEWWQITKEKGFYVSDVEYDESAGTYAVSVGVSANDENGNFIGIIKGVVSIREVIREAESTSKKYGTTVVKLLTADGKLIYATKDFTFLEDVSGKEFFKNIKSGSGFFVAQDEGRERLFSYAHSTGYQSYQGKRWVLVVAHDIEEVLRPAFILRSYIIAVSFFLVAIALGLALVLSRAITNPITKLIKGAEAIGRGNLEERVAIRSKDEIGKLAMTFNQMAESRKHAEEKLQHVLENLQRSNAELEQFAYIASHDLQEPLRMIRSYVDRLQSEYKDRLDTEANELIANAVTGVTRMQKLINDLLAYSRVGRRDKPFEPTECETVLDQALTNLKVAIEESGAEITYRPLPAVKGDSGELVQLFQNLIGNAIKFRSKEKPRIHIAAEKKGNEWVFLIQDNGIGIDPQLTDRIFAIFQRLHKEEEYPGTGVGLAICKKIVEHHGGRIWVESEPGKGSTFYFTIPQRGRHVS
jgi:signal transduction histidine kinase